MATWFAQNSSVNINSVNQWNSAANGSGSWLTWASLDPSDILVANGKTSITINVNTTCARLTTAATGGTAGGGFILSSGITLTAAVEGGSTTCVTLSSGSATIVGNITTSVFAGAVVVSSTGTLTVTGNVTGGSGNAIGITNSSTGTVNITGNVTGGSSTNTFGVSNASTGTVNVTGTVTGGTSWLSSGITNGTGTITITGNVFAGSGSGAHAAVNSSSAGGVITVTGDVYPSTAANALANQQSSGVALGRCTVFGNIFSAVTGYAGVGLGLLTISPTVEVSHAYRIQTGGGIGASRTLYTGGTNLGQPSSANVRSGTTFGASSEYTGTLAVPSPTLVAIGVPTDNTVGSYAPTGGLDAAGVRSAIGLAAANLDTQLSGLQSDTNDIQSRLPAALEGGRIAAALDTASRLAIWNTLTTESFTADSFGELLLISDGTNGRAVKVTGAHHVAADVHECQANGLTASSEITAINTFATRITTGIVQDGAVWQFTANMLELGPAGSGGSGDASQATLLAVKAKTDLIGTAAGATTLLAAAILEPGTITSFPETLTIGDSYTEQNGRSIQIPIVDTDGNPISSTGSLDFANASVTFTLQRSGETDSTRVITGSASFVDPPGTGTGAGAPYAVIEIPASETAKGLKKYKYSGILTFTWTGTGTDVMSFETDTVTFDN